MPTCSVESKPVKQEVSLDTWAIVVAQLAERPRFESSHQQLLLDQYFLELFVENKEKETRNGPFLKKYSDMQFFSFK